MENELEFKNAIDLFNDHEWYLAHDALEEIWHNTIGRERITIQAILQIAVAQVHLSNDNLKGATILYGEGLGRLKSTGIPTLGLDIENLTEIVEQRLKILQEGRDVFNVSEPKLLKR
ncbi:hypothetical protein EV10_1228 [Prochlorococcus marinus str. SS51]|nr:hypothetical protein EV04_0799 [Prochlorococcus marinus str. LG]KGG18812.1 hypothetical protein EV08_1298 [Prochlorococcus marinus str. SS2]KGG23650.1 hypothetical protein EV09_1275 [Prochlorococcus marinus str. SS35]KGG32114.1 hypothetical protein EV10_1228 [Prochlorococcus marinus str. SS51]